MKQKNLLSVILYVLSILLTAGFAYFLVRDYRVSYPYGSAPFWLYAAERAVEFLLPAVILLIAGILIRKRNKSK